jgi:transposase
MNVIAIDIASEVSSVCILDSKGRIKLEERIPTKISKLKALIKQVPRPRKLVFEEGTQAAWLWRELNFLCDDTLVCDPRQAANLSGHFKNDKNDARNLGLRAQANLLKPVWHGGAELQALRESVRTYQLFTEQSTRLKNQLKAVFRGVGLRVGTEPYSSKARKEIVKDLKMPIHRERVQRTGAVLDEVTKQRILALKTMVRLARKSQFYKPLKTIDGIGPIFAAMFISEVGDPHRFRTREQLWSYSGLAVSTHSSSEFEIKNGALVRKTKSVQTRGLVTAYNTTLKYVFKQSALTLSRTKWLEQHRKLLLNSKNPNNALLTLARKLASVMLHIAKTGEKYDIAKAFKDTK